MRRNNLRIVGFAEGEEGIAPTVFISNLIKDLFGLEYLPLIDRAHRQGQVKPNSGQPPRPFILRVHFFHVKEQIIRLAREKGDLAYKEKAINIFGDLTAGEAKRRAAFNDVRKTLQNIAPLRSESQCPAEKSVVPQKAMDYVKSASQVRISHCGLL